jgi:hypothetical protein
MGNATVTATILINGVYMFLRGKVTVTANIFSGVYYESYEGILACSRAIDRRQYFRDDDRLQP